MTLKDLKEYVRQHNINDDAKIGFANLGHGGFAYANDIVYDPNENILNLDLSFMRNIAK